MNARELDAKEFCQLYALARKMANNAGQAAYVVWRDEAAHCILKSNLEPDDVVLYTVPQQGPIVLPQTL